MAPFLRLAAAALFTLVAAAFVLPDQLGGLDRRTPFAQLVAFRPVALAGALVVLALLALVLARTRKVWPFVAGLLAVVLAGGLTLAPRLVANPPGGGRGLTVLTANLLNGSGSVERLAELIARERPDLVALTEVGAAYRARLEPLVRPLGYRAYGSTGPDRPDIAGVTALARVELGELDATVDAATHFPSLELRGGRLDGLRFVTFHSIAPVRGAVGQWLSDLGRLRAWCAGPAPVVVAGDFNATLDHSPFRSAAAGCVDAAERTGDGLVGTWPASAPRAVGVQIDHVLASGGIGAEATSVWDIPGSDHRAVLTRLRLPR
ncbi:endonuclease/exonuclease/phosphatase family protein [Pseudonocardia acaciae]|uniref:endonuclease/exonuclease/phosphatase family protein n=1 Tax=Pseudonocardia acaciae TaxID=551276 RepID=UPI00048F6133|nr:endonuclease/exonuclease/phosphatase family protein [Pseudonocardia acaciae]